MTRSRHADAVVGANIHQRMWLRSISQRQVAAALGVDQGGVSNRLRGKTPLTVGELIVLADMLGVDDFNELLNLNTPAATLVGAGVSEKYGIRDSNPEPADMKHFAVRGKHFTQARFVLAA